MKLSLYQLRGLKAIKFTKRALRNEYGEFYKEGI